MRFWLLLALCLSGCGFAYIAQNSGEQLSLLIRRQSINSLIKTADPQFKRKLELVNKTLTFAREIGIDPQSAYKTYTNVGRDVLSFVVLASKKTSFKLATWRFPIIGKVPYKGFFNIEQARSLAKELETKGYEPIISAVYAFSSLGWFNDPVYSSMLNGHDYNLVNFIIHESLHRNFWIPSQAQFNESLANFVATKASLVFFKNLYSSNPTQDNYSNLQKALNEEKLLFIKSNAVKVAYKKLSRLYKLKLNDKIKLKLRAEIYKKILAKFPDARLNKDLNNSKLLQEWLYYRDMQGFEKLYSCKNQDFKAFLLALEDFKKNKQPFVKLALLGSCDMLANHS